MYLENSTIGQTFILKDTLIEKEKMRAFVREYNPVPIHLDEEYAGKTLFGKVLVASGMMSYMAVWQRLMEIDPFGEELVAGTSAQITWLALVFAGDTLRGKAVISAIRERNSRNGKIIFSISAVNQDGVTMFEATSGAVITRRG